MKAMWTLDNFISDLDRDNGMAGVTLSDFGNVICTWIVMAGRRSVSDVSVTFGASPEAVIEAVRSHYWMYLTSPDGALLGDDVSSIDDPMTAFIELEGE